MNIKKRHEVISLLFLAGVINYLDRSALSVAAPLITKDFHLSPSELGFVFSSFFVGYSLFNFVGGWASDRFGGKLVYALSMAVWSLFCGLTATATGFISLLVIRVIFGMGEGPLAATNNKIIHNWFPHREAASAVGIAFCGTPLGGAVAGPIVGIVAVSFGWQAAFVAAGLLGLVWLVIWQVFMTEKPAQHRSISAEELAEIQSGQTETVSNEEAQPLSFYLRQPLVLATALAFFGYNYILFFFLTWFPSYLTEAQHLSIKDMSLANVLPWFLGFVGLALSGILSDSIFRRTGKALEARKLVLTVCLGVAGLCVILAGLVSTAWSALALMSCAIFFLYLSGGTYWAILQDTVQGHQMGSVSGFIHMISNCAGIIGPSVTGLLVQGTGVFTSAFVLAGAIAALGVLAVLIYVRPLVTAPVGLTNISHGP
jgi:ACS family hexuronate transporter-like MFS transporter